MSEIFDALQRSESGGSKKKDTIGPLRALDVLRRAEELAQSNWDHESTTASSRPEELLEFEAMLKQSTLGSSIRESDAELARQVSSIRERTIPAGQFRSIPVSINTDSHLVCVADADSPAAEAFQLLGVRLRNLREARALQRVLVTSTVPREGKSMVAGNLACTLARSSRAKVLLLEGDVRRPTQSQQLGLEELPGVSEWLQGTASLSETVYHLDSLGFWIMPAGKCPANPLEVLQPGRMSILMSQLSEWFDLVIIDSPPVLPLADTSMWMKLADGVLLVTRQGVSEKGPLQRGIEAIEPKKLIGAILNSSKTLRHSDYYYSVQPDSESLVQS